jgi:hypothetical protein
LVSSLTKNGSCAFAQDDESARAALIITGAGSPSIRHVSTLCNPSRRLGTAAEAIRWLVPAADSDVPRPRDEPARITLVPLLYTHARGIVGADHDMMSAGRNPFEAPDRRSG